MRWNRPSTTPQPHSNAYRRTPAIRQKPSNRGFLLLRECCLGESEVFVALTYSIAPLLSNYREEEKTIFENRTTESLEAESKRLTEELREMQKHPNFPWIDEIPGYKYTTIRLDDIEYELFMREEMIPE